MDGCQALYQSNMRRATHNVELATMLHLSIPGPKRTGTFAQCLGTSGAARWQDLEASPGIEPGCKDLQSSASPLRHEAIGSLHTSKGRIFNPIFVQRLTSWSLRPRSALPVVSFNQLATSAVRLHKVARFLALSLYPIIFPRNRL